MAGTGCDPARYYKSTHKRPGNRGTVEENVVAIKERPPVVSTERGYELRYFARKHGLSTAQANDLLRRFGADRASLNEAAVRLRRSLQQTDA